MDPISIPALRGCSLAAMRDHSVTKVRNGTGFSTSPRKSHAPGEQSGSRPPRRTPASVADKIAALAEDDTVVARFIDYRTAGPGTLPEIFGKADVIVCTEDSSTMISEAVSARLPVVGAAPAAHRFTDEEQDYR